MKICIMTAEIDGSSGPPVFFGFVIGLTLEECKRKARRKWRWYGSADAETKYYAGYPHLKTRWMNAGTSNAFSQGQREATYSKSKGGAG